MLRNSSGEPIGFDELKSKFEAQRARGSQNRVSESEEDMILEALSRLRNTRQKGNGGQEETTGNVASTYSDDMEDAPRNSVAPSVSGGMSIVSTTTTSSGCARSRKNLQPKYVMSTVGEERLTSVYLFGPRDPSVL